MVWIRCDCCSKWSRFSERLKKRLPATAVHFQLSCLFTEHESGIEILKSPSICFFFANCKLRTFFPVNVWFWFGFHGERRQKRHSKTDDPSTCSDTSVQRHSYKHKVYDKTLPKAFSLRKWWPEIWNREEETTRVVSCCWRMTCVCHFRTITDENRRTKRRNVCRAPSRGSSLRWKPLERCVRSRFSPWTFPETTDAGESWSFAWFARCHTQ